MKLLEVRDLLVLLPAHARRKRGCTPQPRPLALLREKEALWKDSSQLEPTHVGPKRRCFRRNGGHNDALKTLTAEFSRMMKGVGSGLLVQGESKRVSCRKAERAVPKPSFSLADLKAYSRCFQVLNFLKLFRSRILTSFHVPRGS